MLQSLARVEARESAGTQPSYIWLWR